MAPRWCACPLLWGEKKLRRVRVHRQIGALQEALQKEILERKSKAAYQSCIPDLQLFSGHATSSGATLNAGHAGWQPQLPYPWLRTG
jgi:hypothetical protein